jgi:murein DD-endopeptidase MepM/ murein hydrolase activator NlpD
MDSSRRFTLVSWGVTALLVIGLLAFAVFTFLNRPVVTTTIMVPNTPEATTVTGGSADLPNIGPGGKVFAISRQLFLKTIVPERPRYEAVKHKVERGDSVFAIAKEFSIKPETLLWANYDVLNDSPDSIRIGQVLNVPATDGVLYQWQEGDTLEAVAGEFKASADDILNWPGNHVDLTNPTFEEGALVMIPGGEREFKQWIIPTIARGSSGTANIAGGACGGGAYGSGAFIWPAANRFLSGNDYWSGHLGIDIAAGEGAPIYAADSGVVTMSASGWNGGYGNVVMIDHGNGYVTLYAHLSQINVARCQSVSQGQAIGASGNTGNSFGAHLHFEVRLNGGFVNPFYVLP